MIKIVLIGSGNLAQHLIVAFEKAAKHSQKIDLIQVYAREAQKLAHLLPLDKITTSFETLKEADIYILAVSDDAIEAVSSQLPFQDRLVVHTSGAASMDLLDAKNRKGVFYPLQSFTKNKKVNFKKIPICIETQTETDYELVSQLAQSISNQIHAVNSEQRKTLHVAAVFVNNFANHLFAIGEDLCVDNKMPFEILQPLIQETVDKISVLSPREAQTGPASRKDLKTIAAHEALLHNENQLKIYQILTQSIQDNGKKL